MQKQSFQKDANESTAARRRWIKYGSLLVAFCLCATGAFFAGRQSMEKQIQLEREDTAGLVDTANEAGGDVVDVEDTPIPLDRFPTEGDGGRQVAGAYVVDGNAGLVPDSTDAATANTLLINSAFDRATVLGLSTLHIVGDYYIESSGWTHRYSSPLYQRDWLGSDTTAFGIIVPSGFTLDLSGATLRMKPNGDAQYALISVCDASDVTISGGRLIGDLPQHDFSSGGTHEHGHGIMINTSTNTTIAGVTISDMVGDGINLICFFEDDPDIRDTTIRGNTIFDCRRQGISVASGVNTLIENNNISNIGGTPPGYGVDIELQSSFRCDGTIIRNNIFTNCQGGSIACHNGSNYQVYDNNCGDGNIVAYKPQNVIIRDNTMYNTYVSVSELAVNVQASVPDPDLAVLSIANS